MHDFFMKKKKYLLSEVQNGFSFLMHYFKNELFQNLAVW